MAAYHDTPALPSRLLRTLLVSTGVLLSALLGYSHAQMTLDGSLGGPRGALPGPHYTIPDRVGQIRGPNLFHSFGQFNLSQGESATFTGPNTIANILSRVTGGSPSSIDGTIRSQIPGANLYLLNPSGVLFGPNASLDVSGSFHVSTADYLRFADGARFSAHLSDTSVLTVAPPAAFGFLGPMPAAIMVQGSTLQVPEGNTVALVGGDMTLRGKGSLPADGVPTLGAPGGQIHLVSVAAAGEVPSNFQAFTGETVARLGHVALSQGAFLDASGDGGGTVRIRSGRLLVDQAFVFAENRGRVEGKGLGVDLGITEDASFTNGAAITTDSLGAGRARDLRLTAGRVSLDDVTIGSRPFKSGDGGNVLVQAETLTVKGGSISTETLAGSGGNAGSLTVQVGTLALTDGAQISSSTRGAGQGGTVTVAARDTITLAGQSSQGTTSGVFSNALAGTGGGGMVLVTAPQIEMAGSRIQARSAAASSGNAGSIRVEAGTLTLIEGARISSSTFSAGQGGTVTIAARDTITLAGQDSQGTVSGLFASAEQGSSGNAGALQVEAGTLVVRDGAQIVGGTRGAGQGGTVTVAARDRIMLAGQSSQETTSGVFSNALAGTGGAGMVSVTAPQIEMAGSRIQARSAAASSGNAGSIRVEAGTLTLIEGAQISSNTAGTGQGGTVTVTATEAIAISGQGSGLFSNAFSAGDAGQLVISAPTLTMDDGLIQTRAAEGNRETAANLDVRVGTLTLTGGAQLDSSTDGSGRGGTLRVVATEAIAIRGTDSQGNRSGVFSNALAGTGGAGMVSVTAPQIEMAGSRIQARSAAASSGNAGSIRVEAGTLTLIEGAQISSNTAGTGQGGTVTVTATEAIAISGQGSGLFSNAFSAGDAGQLVISAPTLTMDDGLIQTRAAEGNRETAANLDVRVGTLTLTGGAQLDSSTDGSGRGGTLRVVATEAIAIRGTDSQGNRSGVFSNALAGTGGAGMVLVTAPQIEMAGSRIQARSAAASSGNAGSIRVEAGTLTLIEGARISSSTFSAGQGGTVTIAARDTITLAGQDSQGTVSGLFASAEQGSSGNAGALQVEAGTLVVRDGAQIVGGTRGAGQGGTVTVAARDRIMLAGQSSQETTSGVFSNALAGTGGAGMVSVTAPQIEMAGSRIQARSAAASSGNAGSIRVEAGTLTLIEGAQISSNTAGTGQGGTVTVTATEAIAISGQGSGLFSNAFSAGDAGQLVISAPTLTMDDGLIQTRAAEGNRETAANLDVRVGTLTLTGGAQLDSSTDGSGRGGTLRVVATEAIAIRGTDSQGNRSGVFSNALAGTGGAGMVLVTAPQIEMAGSRIQAQSAAASSGNAGSIRVEAGTLTLTGGAGISSSTFSAGQGGEVSVRATEALAISGTDSQGNGSGLFSQANPGSRGNAGSLEVQAGRLTLTEGGRISSSTFGQGDAGRLVVFAPTLSLDGGLIQAVATAESRGNAGSLEVQAGRLTLTGGGQISSSTSGPGQGGSVTIKAPDTVTIEDPASGIFASTAGEGPGGNIAVQAQQIALSDGGTISTRSTGQGNAGNIVLQAGERFQSRRGAVTTAATKGAQGGTIVLQAGRLVQLRDSQVITSVPGGGGDAGNLTLTAPFIVASGSQVVANAFGGQGGNISIQAQTFLRDPASTVDASSKMGINGQVNIQAPVTSLSGAVAPLPQAFAQSTELLRSRCAARLREGTVSRLVVGGRDGVPLEPGSLLLSPLQRVDEAGVQEGKQQPQNLELQHAWVSSAQAHAREGWEGECARWMGQPGTPGSPQRRR